MNITRELLVKKTLLRFLRTNLGFLGEKTYFGCALLCKNYMCKPISISEPDKNYLEALRLINFVFFQDKIVLFNLTLTKWPNHKTV
jgi:hypothetical protein